MSDNKKPESPTGEQEAVENAFVRFATDDSQGVLNLRNLLRQGKINKEQYVGSLASLVAMGLIPKAEFTRLKYAIN